MHSLDPTSVLLPGQGTQPRDRRPVEGWEFRALRVVVAAVRWMI
ncbi:hypothetical protein [Halolamina sp. CBA1230]|nr:hypothetical protein [Halolamina sp. CBA1230]